MTIDEIRYFLNDYFEVLQTHDMTIFEKIFHKECRLYAIQDKTLVASGFTAYQEMMQHHLQAPIASGHPRDDQILMVDILSPSMAAVKVRIRLFNHIILEHLNLMKHDGQWMVYAKHFHKSGSD